MSIAINLFLIVLAINLLTALVAPPEANAPMIAGLKSLWLGNATATNEQYGSTAITTTGFWDTVLKTFGSNAGVYIILIGLIAGVSLLTGANPLTGGGGYGAILVLQILAIAIFSSFFLMPNFSGWGMPPIINFVCNVIFGGLLIVSVIGLLRGYD